MKKYLLFFILMSVFFCQTAMADFYKWVDEKGETQITDYPPPENKVSKDVQVHKSQPADKTTSENTDDSSKTKAKEKINVILYTKNNCMDCDKARDFLNSQNITLTEYNMDTDPNAIAKRKEIDSDEDVPLAIINKSQVHGFSESVYKKVLKTDQ